MNQLIELINMLKKAGKSEEEISKLLREIHESSAGKDNFKDILDSLLVENSGKISEEKVFVNDNNEEIPFESTLSDARIVDGEFFEEKKQSFYATHGRLDQPIVCVDYAGHRLTEDEIKQCYHCHRYSCSKCSIFHYDEYDFVEKVICIDCFPCTYCEKPLDWEGKTGMYIVKDGLGNIIRAYHNECNFLNRLLNIFFVRN